MSSTTTHPHRRSTDNEHWRSSAEAKALLVILLMLASSVVVLFYLTVKYHNLAAANDRTVRSAQVQLYHAQLESCGRQNEARRAANRGVIGLSNFLQVVINVTKRRAQLQHGEVRHETLQAINLYNALLGSEQKVPLVPCNKVIHLP